MSGEGSSWGQVEGHPELQVRRVEWPKDLELVRGLFKDYRTWIADHAEPGEKSAPRVKAGLADLDSIIGSLPGAYDSPRGEVLLWFKGDVLIACGALRELEPNVGELKRVYIRPDYRGEGFGKPFIQALMLRSRGLGYQRLRSYALGSMAGAHDFYQELGFSPIPAYWPHPASGVVFFERVLG